MKYYELAYLISPKLSEEELKDIQEKINSLIQKEEGILGELKNPFRQKLTYPIKKEKGGYLLGLTFHLLPEKLENLEKKLKNLPEILRFLLVTKRVARIETPPKKIMPEITPRLKFGLGVKTPTPKFGVGVKKEKKVELAEIEKKLKEILGE